MFGADCEMECRAFAGFGVYPDAAAMPLHDLFADSKPDARSLEAFSSLSALKQLKYSFLMRRLNTDAIVLNRKKPLFLPSLGPNFNPGRIGSMKLYRVRQKVLKELHHLGAISHDLRQFIGNNCATALLAFRLKIGLHYVKRFRKVNTFFSFLYVACAYARIGQEIGYQGLHPDR